MKRKGELSSAQMDRNWPHQIAVPEHITAGAVDRRTDRRRRYHPQSLAQSFKEMIVLAEHAKHQGAQRVICDHPFFLRLSIEQTLEIASHGVWINFTAGEILPRWWRASVSDFAAAIRKVGVSRSIISWDCGQLHNPPMVEALRMTCQLMLEEGFSADEIRMLLSRSPASVGAADLSQPDGSRRHC